MNKKTLFKLFVSIGILVIATVVLYCLGANVSEYVTLFTALPTALYAVSTARKRPEPFLRITPILGQAYPLTYITLRIKIENIVAETIAKNIEVKCRLVPDASIFVMNKGVVKHPSPLTKEDPPVEYPVLEQVNRNELFSQKLVYEYTCLNEDDKKQKMRKGEIALAEKITELEDKVKREKFPSPQPFFPKS
jgi:hypothetical protein